MSYAIIDELLKEGDPDRPGTALHPEGVIIHETATPNATAEGEDHYFQTHDAHASAHYFVDAEKIVRMIPESEWAYHAGPEANERFLSIELCHFDDPATFEEIWNKGVWLAADMCHRYGWAPADAVHSHEWVSEKWHEVDHTDPVGYFAHHNRTMDEFVTAVESMLSEMQKAADAPANAPAPTDAPPAPTVPEGMLGEGSTGEEVGRLQTDLNELGFDCGTVDDDFGPTTKAAVEAFQRHAGIGVDGVVGPETEKVLAEELAKHIADANKPPEPKAPVPVPDGILHYGTTSDGVRELQHALNQVDYAYHALREDGCYGPDTRGAVTRFQRHFDLTPDGVYGPKTEDQLKKEVQA